MNKAMADGYRQNIRDYAKVLGMSDFLSNCAISLFDKSENNAANALIQAKNFLLRMKNEESKMNKAMADGYHQNIRDYAEMLGMSEANANTAVMLYKKLSHDMEKAFDSEVALVQAKDWLMQMKQINEGAKIK